MQSMCGFGRAEKKEKNFHLIVEITSLNHKSYEFNFTIPREIKPLEYRMRTFIKQKIKRGRLDIFINFKNSFYKYKFNKKKALELFKIFLSLKKELNLKEEITISEIFNFPGIINLEEKINITNLWEKLKPTLRKALDNLLVMREKEGKTLSKEINARITKIEEKVKTTKKIFDNISNNIRKEQLSNIRKIEGDIKELQKEKNSLSKNDITEELVRIKSHLHQFKNTFKIKGTTGIKLGFITQEINREVNTLISKIDNFKIASLGIEIKDELEKIKQQVQNIE